MISSNMIAGILVGHGELPDAIYKTIQSIIGPQEYFQIVSNENASADELKQRLEGAIEKLKSHDILIFADLLGGSCGIVSGKIIKAKKTPNICLICPVQVPMLIKFFQCRDKHNLQDLIQLLVETGKSEIKVIKP